MTNITFEMIEAATDKAHALSAEIVLGCHGAGNAAVLIDRALAECRLAAIEEAARVADERFADRGYHPAARNAGIGIAASIRNLVSEELPS